MPVRIQRRRTKGWQMPEGAVAVTRPGIFGNPFVAQAAHEAGYQNGAAAAVEAFREWMLGAGKRGTYADTLPEKRERIEKNLHRLRGKDLACWCPLDGRPCHADVLLELANA